MHLDFNEIPPKSPIDNVPLLVHVMVWIQTGEKPLAAQ